MSNQEPRSNTRARRYIGRQILAAFMGLLGGVVWYLLIRATWRFNIKDFLP